MRVVIAGGLGFIGQALTEEMKKLGYQVNILTHSDVKGDRISGRISKWDPFKGELDLDFLEAADVVINLSGESIACRWTNQKKRKIRDSRIFSTRTLVKAIERLQIKPTLFINASAIGYYGTQQQGELTEESLCGEGFLASVCKEWEEEAQPVQAMGVRLVIPRIGMVISKEGGALKKMLPLFKWGVGGMIGEGRQWMSWIDLRDLVRLFLWMIQHEKINGVVNAVSPSPLTNREFTQILAQTLHRPAWLSLPGFAARLLFDEMADEVLLHGSYVVPQKLQDNGFMFEYPTLEKSLEKYTETL